MDESPGEWHAQLREDEGGVRELPVPIASVLRRGSEAGFYSCT